MTGAGVLVTVAVTTTVTGPVTVTVLPPVSVGYAEVKLRMVLADTSRLDTADLTPLKVTLLIPAVARRIVETFGNNIPTVLVSRQD